MNKEVVYFGSVLALAADRGLISSPLRVRQLKEKPSPKRRLLTPEDIEALLSHCTPEVTQNADLLKFYLRFLTLTGAREQEALRVRWADVDLENAQVTIGSAGDAKNARSRTVDFTPELAALLQEMVDCRQPDSSFLFPSTRRGGQDIPSKSLRAGFQLVRRAAGLPWVGFHDFRHAFTSRAVMAGIDFLTIASWLGHQDGGVLVGKVYGHLADSHKRAMARKLSEFTNRKT